ncbi:MAG: hypothetical protein VYA89_06810 [Actinomycetota bacterium]|nr:hypothetical protein [Actinomycetota bacterium]MEE2957882.1 hypothetical protein [Actinomycetota bacterium]
MSEMNDRTKNRWRPARIAAATGSVVAGSLLVAGLATTGPAGAHPVETRQVEASQVEKGDRPVHRPGSHRSHFVSRLADFLDLDRRVLGEALRSGATLADLAGDRTDGLVAELVAASTDRIERAVADGRLDQDRADEILGRVEARVEARVRGERPNHLHASARRDRGHGLKQAPPRPKAGRGASVR